MSEKFLFTEVGEELREIKERIDKIEKTINKNKEEDTKEKIAKMLESLAIDIRNGNFKVSKVDLDYDVFTNHRLTIVGSGAIGWPGPDDIYIRR